MKPIMRQIRFIKVKKVGFYLAGMTALCDGTLKPEVKQKSFFVIFFITLQKKLDLLMFSCDQTK